MYIIIILSPIQKNPILPHYYTVDVNCISLYKVHQPLPFLLGLLIEWTLGYLLNLKSTKQISEP